mgnify:CR=1 FL=1
MVLEHVGMPQPGDCRVVFSASAEELEAAIQAEQAAENPPQAEEDLLTAAVNRAILTGFFHIISGACGKRASGSRDRSEF